MRLRLGHTGQVEPGDVLLLHCASGQFHLAIAAPSGGFIHAHAGLRRVVTVPACPEGEQIGHWRLLELRN